MAAQDAELKLKVSLDLAFFRQQLTGLGQAAAGYNVPVQVQFKKESIVSQFRLLSSYLGRKTFDVKITSRTLEGLAGKVETLHGQLKALKDEKIELDVNINASVPKFGRDKTKKIRAQIRRDILSEGGQIPLDTKLNLPNVATFVKNLSKQAQIVVGLKNGATGKEVQNVLDAIQGRIEANQKIKQGGGKLRVPVSVKPGINNEDIAAFKTAVQSKLGGVTVKIKAELEGGVAAGKSKFATGKTGYAGLEEYMRTQGTALPRLEDIAGKVRREEFRTAISGQGITKLKDIARQVGVEGFSKYKSENAAQLIDKLVQEASIEAITKYLDIKAVMRNPNREPLRQVLDTFARGIFHMLGIDPASLKQARAATIQSATRTMQAAQMPSTASVRLLPAQTQRTAISQGVEGIYRNLLGSAGGGAPGGVLVDTKRIYAALQKNLDEILQRQFTVIEVDVSETSMGIKSAMNAFAYLAQALRDAETRAKQAQVGAAVSSLLQKVTNALRLAEAQAVIPVSVKDITARPQEPQFRPGSRVPLTMAPQRALPAAGGTTPPSQMRFNAVSGGAVLGQPQFMRAPSIPAPIGGGGGKQPPMTELPKGYFDLATKYSAALKVAQATADKFKASQLPLIGGLREIGGEFANATKQVLLYGTAYRGLAFITGLPGRVLNAAKSQQQYNNSLQTATQDTGTYGKELLYVDNVQRAFGLNLETTRTGFTRLFASMGPSGFDSGSIEKLFTGISAATAALQLTPDKAERVIYAFGQMASKGQIMSEELKGQLGDVLPGALAIFAKAAGMSVKEFSKAMEDGEFVGKRFREVFANVSDELMTRFGTGAQAAGRSLQGLLNTVQGDFQRTLESFAPLANAAAQAILVPLGGSLNQLSKSAQIATGEIERSFTQLQDAQKNLGVLKAGGASKDEIRGAEQSVAALTVRYNSLIKAAQDPAIAKQAADIRKFAEELGKAGTFVMNMVKGISGFLSPVLTVLGTNLTSVIGGLTALFIGFQTARTAALIFTGVMLALRGVLAGVGILNMAIQMGSLTKAMTASGVSAKILAAGFQFLGLQMEAGTVAAIGLKGALLALTAASVIGLAIAGVSMLAGAFMTMRDRAKEAADASKNAIAEGAKAAASGEVMGVTTQLNQELAKNRAVERGLKTLEDIYARNRSTMRQGGKPIISVREMAQLKAAAEYSNEIAGIISGNQLTQGGFQIQAFLRPQLAKAQQQAGQISAETKKSTLVLKEQQKQALQTQKQLGINQPTPSVATAIAEDGQATQAKAQSLESLESLADQLAKARTEGEIERANILFEHKKKLLDMQFAYEESGADEIQQTRIKFAKELSDAMIGYEEEVFKARQAVTQAAGSVAPGNRPPNAPKGQGPYGPITDFGAGLHSNIREGMQVGSLAPARPVSGSEKRDVVAAAKTEQAQLVEALRLNTSLEQAIKKVALITKQNLDALFPVAQLTLQNKLLATRNALELKGIPKEVIDLKESLYLAEEKSNGILQELRDQYNKQLPIYEKYKKMQEDGIELTKAQRVELATAAIAVELFGQNSDYATDQLQKFTTAQLENTLATLKQQDALKAIQEISGRINQAVEGVTGTYKDLFKEIAKGTNSVEALKKAQDALADQFLTMFFDFAMKPVEDFFKKTLGSIFKVPNEEETRANMIKKLEEQLAKQQEIASNTKRTADNTQPGGGGAPGAVPPQQSANTIGPSMPSSNPQDASYQQGGAASIASELPLSAFTSISESLGTLTDSATAYAEKLKTVTVDSWETVKLGGKVAQDAKDNGDKFKESLGKATQAVGIAAGAIMGIAAGINQIKEGGTSNVLGGIGSILLSVGGAIAGFGNVFNLKGFANGGVAKGGFVPFRAFANGGTVGGPTLGLMGEGKYNEAIVPLPDGRSIPVRLNSSSIREKMTSQAASPVLNMSFQTTNIGGTEYVSRDQLEQAMAQTRKLAANDGARRGMGMTLDRLQQSPSTRSRLGMR